MTRSARTSEPRQCTLSIYRWLHCSGQVTVCISQALPATRTLAARRGEYPKSDLLTATATQHDAIRHNTRMCMLRRVGCNVRKVRTAPKWCGGVGKRRWQRAVSTRKAAAALNTPDCRHKTLWAAARRRWCTDGREATARQHKAEAEAPRAADRRQAAETVCRSTTAVRLVSQRNRLRHSVLIRSSATSVRRAVICNGLRAPLSVVRKAAPLHLSAGRL